MSSDPEAVDEARTSALPKRGVRAVGRGLLWPARRFVDPRLEGVLAHVDRRSEELYGRIAEQVTEIEPTLSAKLDALAERLDALDGRLSAQDALALESRHELERILQRVELPGSLEELRIEVADFLNFALGYRGFSAQAGLWFNAPVEVVHRPGAVEALQVSERIAEIPYVFRALGTLPPGARILDVGAAESTVSLSLASLGYEVTALDPRPYPFSHPRLDAVQARVEEWETDARFDAVICLSTIEHVGLSAYEQEENTGADREAMRRLHELTSPGGRLVLTAPFGEFHVDSFQRTYDREHLDELLEGWEIDDFALLRRTAPTRWELSDETASADEGALVVLVTASRLG